MRSPGLQNITPDAEKSDLSDGIDDISPNPQKTMKKYEKHTKQIRKKIKHVFLTFPFPMFFKPSLAIIFWNIIQNYSKYLLNIFFKNEKVFLFFSPSKTSKIFHKTFRHRSK